MRDVAFGVGCILNIIMVSECMMRCCVGEEEGAWWCWVPRVVDHTNDA